MGLFRLRKPNRPGFLKGTTFRSYINYSKQVRLQPLRERLSPPLGFAAACIPVQTHPDFAPSGKNF
jgi:hypothetical protein